MKKVLFIAVVAVASLASCKKDRVCTCTESSNVPGDAPSTSIVTYTKAKKGDARSHCLSGTMTSSGYTYTRTCTLK